MRFISVGNSGDGKTNADAHFNGCPHLPATVEAFAGFSMHAGGKNHAFCRRKRSRCPQKAPSGDFLPI
jgi:hypothetical protein